MVGTGPAARKGRVLLTDHPWPDVAVESAIVEAAGYELVDVVPGGGPSSVAPEALVALAAAVDPVAIVTNWARVTGALIGACPHLQVVARLGVGIDNVDVAAARSRGVAVTRVPGYCTEEASDHVVAMVLGWARQLPWFDRDTHAGGFAPGARALRRVRDLTVGVWGAGAIGTATATKLAALGCSVLVDDHHGAGGRPFPGVAVDELVSASDVVSLHLPLTDATRGRVDAGVLARMRPGALLVNTARGALVVVDDLVAALDAGRPGAAALDVFPDEPRVPPALAGRHDVILTPHVAFSSTASVAEVRRRALEDVVRVLSGEPALDPWTAPA